MIVKISPSLSRFIRDREGFRVGQNKIRYPPSLLTQDCNLGQYTVTLVQLANFNQVKAFHVNLEWVKAAQGNRTNIYLGGNEHIYCGTIDNKINQRVFIKVLIH